MVNFHFGLPSVEWIRALQGAGIYTLATATSLEEARQIQELGIDAIVAQGIEAGGHRGISNPDVVDEKLSTSVLVRLLVKNMNLSIIAAGGIMDGQGIKAAMELGAAAAQFGTAFILCPESSANEGYRINLKSERAAVTHLTSALLGRPAQGIRNRFINHAALVTGIKPPAYPVAYDAAKQLNAAATKLGNHEFAALWAGQGVPIAREIPATQLFSVLVKELSG